MVDFSGSNQPGSLNKTFNPQLEVKGVSPAFNVDLNSVIYTTLVKEPTDTTGPEYKLTLSDNELNIAIKKDSVISRNDEYITVPYTITGGNKDKVDRVSVLLTDKVYTPGVRKTDGFEFTTLDRATGTFILPDKYKDKKCGKDYYAYILAEDVAEGDNKDHETDYASVPVPITIPSLPKIMDEPEDLSLAYGYKSGNRLTVKAQGETLSYQWYSSKDNSYNGTKIPGATKGSYDVPTGYDAGTEEYYYCEVTDSRALPSLKSRIAKVSVEKADDDYVEKGVRKQDSYLDGLQLEAVTDQTIYLPYLPDGAAYKENITINGGEGFITSCSIDVNKAILIVSTAKQTESKKAVIKVPVSGGKNYKDYVLEVTIQPKRDAGVKIKGGDRTVTYGDDSFTLEVDVADEGEIGTLSFHVEDPSIAEIENSTQHNGIVTIKAAGKTRIKAFYESTPVYGEDYITLTVNKADSVITTEPKGKTGLKYNGSEQELITPGKAEGGELKYALAKDEDKPDAALYTVSAPSAKDAGDYTVWYKVFGDGNHNDTAEKSISVNIAERNDPGHDDPEKEDSEKDVQDKEITGLGTGAICDPDHPSEGNNGWTGNYVYYGNYDADKDGKDEPVKYRVLDTETDRFGGNTLFLDCDSVLYPSVFDNEEDVEWKESLVRSGLMGYKFYEKDGVFEAPEKEAIHESTIDSHDLIEGTEEGQVSAWTKDLSEKYTALDNEKIFLLDAEDVSNIEYGYSTTNEACNDRKKNGSLYWWLRSSFRNNRYAFESVSRYPGLVMEGKLDFTPMSTGPGVSPAFNVDREHIIFTSLIPGSTDEYKLTLRDDEIKIAVTEGSNISKDGNTVTVPYTITGTDAEKTNRVSVLILESPYKAGETKKDGVVYQKLTVDPFVVSGIGTFTLPDAYAGKECGKDYYVYILAEAVNGRKETDYASAPVSIEMKPTEVIFTDPGQFVASQDDNFAPVVPGASEGVGGNIKNQELDFANVLKSGVDPSALKMSAIAGSKFKTRAKVKDKNSVQTSGGVKAKFNKKDSTVTLTCKSNGTATLTMEDDNTYTIGFTVEKPKAVKAAKTMAIGGSPATKSVLDLFGTHINSGKLTIAKQKHNQATLSENNLLNINPAEKDSIKIQYQYLNKKYKMTIKVK